MPATVVQCVQALSGGIRQKARRRWQRRPRGQRCQRRRSSCTTPSKRYASAELDRDVCRHFDPTLTSPWLVVVGNRLRNGPRIAGSFGIEWFRCLGNRHAGRRGDRNRNVEPAVHSTFGKFGASREPYPVRECPHTNPVWRKDGAPCPAKHSTTSPPFEPMSKRRKGFPSESQVKRGVRVVHGDKELAERLGRNDLCPCGSARPFRNCCLKSGRF
jgi:hypothetical protein